MKPKFKTVIVVWSDEDPTDKYELVDVAQEATDGSFYCSKTVSERVEDPATDPDWDGTDFFGSTDGDEEYSQ